MAYAAAPDTPRARPSTVNTAVLLLYVVAALQLIGLILALSTMSTLKDAYEKAYAGSTGADTASSVATFTTVFAVVFAVLFAVGFVLLAIFDGRGSNVARIITWVVGGIFVCCTGLGLAGSAASSSFGNMGGGSSGGPSAADVQKAVQDALPSWYGPATTTLGILQLLAILGVIILLALPKSHPFFRKSTASTWEPPVPPAAGLPPTV